MKRTLIVLAGFLIVMSVCGCVSTMIAEKTASVAAPPDVEKFSFDLSTPSGDIGNLIVQCRQPSYQMSVARYAIKIDSRPSLVVAKQSDTNIKLDAGKHTLKLYAVSSNPEESEMVSFGKPSTREIVIIKDQEQKLKYTGPYRLFGAGKVEEVQ